MSDISNNMDNSDIEEFFLSFEGDKEQKETNNNFMKNDIHINNITNISAEIICDELIQQFSSIKIDSDRLYPIIDYRNLHVSNAEIGSAIIVKNIS